MKRTIAVVLATLAMLIGAGPAWASPVVHGSCTTWRYVQPASNPTANDVLARACWQVQTDSSTVVTYRRIWLEAYMPSTAAGTSRSFYVDFATVGLSTYEPCSQPYGPVWGQDGPITVTKTYTSTWVTTWVRNQVTTNSPSCNVTRDVLHSDPGGGVDGQIILARNSSFAGETYIDSATPTSTVLAF